MDAPHSDTLAAITRAAADLAGRRGEHAAALWSVGDFLSGIDGCLVPWLDTQALEGGFRLAVQKDERGQWGLFVVNGAECLPACQAPAEIAVMAVKRMPEFLQSYQKRLQAAAGGKVSATLARQLVEAVTQRSAATPSP